MENMEGSESKMNLLNYVKKCDLIELPKNIVIVDIETTGVNDNCSIHEVGAINGLELFAQSFRPKPGTIIQEGATAVNGADWKVLDARPISYAEGMAGFSKWINKIHETADERLIMAGMNCGQFDLKFIEREFNALGFDFPFQYRVLDLHSIGLFWIIGSKKGNDSISLNSNKLSESLGVLPEYKPHVGLSGALWSYFIISKLVKNQALLFS
jgi:DNA polymerase III epsilon subunit-like protein